jgi:hypothetical protein
MKQYKGDAIAEAGPEPEAEALIIYY